MSKPTFLTQGRVSAAHKLEYALGRELREADMTNIEWIGPEDNQSAHAVGPLLAELEAAEAKKKGKA